MSQIIFSVLLLITIGVFAYSAYRIYQLFRLTKPAYPVKDFGKRIKRTIVNAFFQERIFRNRIAGFMHAMVFWGFCLILLGSIEMVIDGIAGTERVLASLGIVYDIIIGAGDVFAYIIAVFIIVFIFRRTVLNIKRLHGKELQKKNHMDALVALSFILILMLTLAGMNIFYIAGHPDYVGIYPVSAILAPLFSNVSSNTVFLIHDICWWSHIIMIFIFANVLPYSKHFHIFMSIPNVFFSRLTPLGKMTNMDSITKEVKLMMNPETAFAAAPENEAAPTRFGILDAEDITWKNYIDSLACTQCGRCTAVCPANITGKELSPRKMVMNIRQRMKMKGHHLVNNPDYSDGKTLIRDLIKEEEIWACTTCNACAKECPLNIDHPTFILDLRRYLVMEESAAPAALNAIFSNIENNGAPWQYSNQDRLKWTE
ncbi:MAG: (Fe-S)-binding protein [Bacteroidales bacterium]|nr:(Fe-S)-binding protein [Bacteroidales bacterium]MDD3860841.1 (Fe-S)-binding protein [Bacteroidales bacterium]